MKTPSLIAPAVAVGLFGVVGLGAQPATSSPFLATAAVGEAAESNLVTVRGSSQVAPRRAANRAYVPSPQVIGGRRIATRPGGASVALYGPAPYTGPNAASPAYPTVSAAYASRRGIATGRRVGASVGAATGVVVGGALGLAAGVATAPFRAFSDPYAGDLAYDPSFGFRSYPYGEPGVNLTYTGDVNMPGRYGGYFGPSTQSACVVEIFGQKPDYSLC